MANASARVAMAGKGRTRQSFASDDKRNPFVWSVVSEQIKKNPKKKYVFTSAALQQLAETIKTKDLRVVKRANSEREIW